MPSFTKYLPWANGETMPTELCATLGAVHVLAAPLLLDVHLALGALLGQNHHELHLDILVVGLVLPPLNQEAGHCVVFLSATLEAKLFSTGATHHRSPGSLLNNNTKTRRKTIDRQEKKKT